MLVLASACRLACAATIETGSIELGAARVIFNESAGRASISVRNKTDRLRLMSNSVVKIDSVNRKGLESTNDFLAAPGVMLLKPDDLALVRIVRARKGQPSDRESLYLLEMKFIPQKDGQGQLKTVLTTLVKLFYRPKSIERVGAVEWAAKRVVFSAEGSALTLKNPSPYWLTIKRLVVDGSDLLAQESKSPLLAPFGSLQFNAVRPIKHAPNLTAITEAGYETDLVTLQSEKP